MAKVYAHPSDVTGAQAFYTPTPTGWTVFTRTFLPWQLWRFAWINLKMVEIIARSHHRHPRRA